jgi:hypothetical protein
MDAHQRAVYIRIHNPGMGQTFYCYGHNSFAATTTTTFAAVAAAAAAPPPFDQFIPGQLRLTD